MLCALAGAQHPISAAYPDGYYTRMDGKRAEALKAAAKACVSTHTRLEYYDLPNYWQYSDVYPETVNGLKRWWDMYSDAVYLIQAGQSGKQSFSANKMQREHAVPKSWWKVGSDVEYTPCYSDMWNLYPSDPSANQAKLNYPFGETRTTSFDNGVTKVGPPKSGYGGGSPEVFEPADEYKGDFARAIFYVATVYDDLPWKYDYMFVKQTYPTLLPWAVNMLLQWSRKDPVDQKEIDRNNAVQQYQGNRNPFIDFPNLAEYIWGQRVSEDFIIADQPNTGLTPPITGDPELTAPVNGEYLDFGEIAVNVTTRRGLQISGSNLTQPLTLRVVGEHRDYFIPEVQSVPASTINSGGGYLLDISYRPKEKGSHSAKLTLSDGGLEGSIVVNLKGEALDRPELYALTALEPADLTESSYTARWNAPAGIADFYVLTRVRYTDSGEEAETYDTGETEYLLQRDPNVPESYSVTYYRLGLESPSSNTIYIAAAGLHDIRTQAPCHIYACDGGIVIRCAEGEGGLIRIFNVNGITVASVAEYYDGMQITLAPGVYIATIGGSAPQRIIVL